MSQAEPKAFAGFHLTVTTTSSLRSRAEEVGVSYSELADLMIRFGLEKLPLEKLRAWASTKTSTRSGRSGAALTLPEREVLESLRRAGPGALRRPQDFPGPVAAVRGALSRLALRGLVHSWTADGGEDLRDRWGHPLDSWWWLAEHSGPADRRRLHVAVSWLRDRARDTYCVSGIEIARAELVHNHGLTVAAVGLPPEKELDHALGKREVSEAEFGKRWAATLHR